MRVKKPTLYKYENITLGIRDEGQAKKGRRPILYIPGWGFSSLMGEAAFGALRKNGWRLITVDLPGVGQADGKSSFVHIQRISKALANYLRENEGHGSIVIGHSFGSMVAQEMAMNEDDVIKKVVLISTLPGIGGLVPDLHTSMDLLNRLMMGEMGIFSQLFTPGNLKQLKVKLGKEFDDLDAPVPTQVLSGQVWAASRWSNIGRVHQIYQPTLIVHGDKDPLCPVANARLMASHVENAQLKILPCGYLPFLEKPEEALEALEKFALD
jgi:pimeloyl-ACP methyl ester carboxylesterase